MRALRIACLLFGSGAALVMADAGCAKEEAATPRASERGEVCRGASDCAPGLACAPLANASGPTGAGVCVTGDFGVRKTGRECVLVECTTQPDCCDETLREGCANLERTCADAGAPGCAGFELTCACFIGRVDCTAGKCVSRCVEDRDCANSGTGSRRKCAGGHCVQCAIDADCTSPGQSCVASTCQAGCVSDGDCGGFDRCVGGKCLAGGCQSDRECIAATRNVIARCGIDGTCLVPCATDLECDNPTNYGFYSCIDHLCTYTGCETDKDCRLLYTGVSDASTLPPKQRAICRDKDIVGDVVKSAP